jgi:hypothetical protein
MARIASSAPRSMKGPKQMTLRRLIRRAGNARLTSRSGYLLNDGYADRHCRFHCFNTSRPVMLPGGRLPARERGSVRAQYQTPGKRSSRLFFSTAQICEPAVL